MKIETYLLARRVIQAVEVGAVALVALAFTSQTALAQSYYIYLGHPFSFAQSPYTTSMHVTALLQLVAPLAPATACSEYDMSATGNRLILFDGLHILDSALADPVTPASRVFLETGTDPVLPTRWFLISTSPITTSQYPLVLSQSTRDPSSECAGPHFLSVPG
jgi:hypothetical protein